MQRTQVILPFFEQYQRKIQTVLFLNVPEPSYWKSHVSQQQNPDASRKTPARVAVKVSRQLLLFMYIIFFIWCDAPLFRIIFQRLCSSSSSGGGGGGGGVGAQATIPLRRRQSIFQTPREKFPEFLSYLQSRKGDAGDAGPRGGGGRVNFPHCVNEIPGKQLLLKFMPSCVLVLIHPRQCRTLSKDQRPGVWRVIEGNPRCLHVGNARKLHNVRGNATFFNSWEDYNSIWIDRCAITMTYL